MPESIRDVDLTKISLTHDSVKNLYGQYVTEFKKDHPASEFEERLSIFEKNVKKIAEHNKDPSATYTMGINQFADLKPEEMQMYTGLRTGGNI